MNGVRILQETWINPKLFINLVHTNGQYYTFVMHKTQEPNLFTPKEQISGNVYGEKIKEYEKER